jgi:hypothetical protein
VEPRELRVGVDDLDVADGGAGRGQVVAGELSAAVTVAVDDVAQRAVDPERDGPAQAATPGSGRVRLDGVQRLIPSARVAGAANPSLDSIRGC